MANQTINMNEALNQYLLDVSIRDSDVAQALRAKTAKMPEGHMQIAPEQGQFMGWLVQLIGARKTLDIGVFTGYSSLMIAMALPQDGKVIGIDSNHEWTKMAKTAWEQAGVAHKVDLKLGLAADILQSLIDNGEAHTFDFAFVDADKLNYDQYYEL